MRTMQRAWFIVLTNVEEMPTSIDVVGKKGSRTEYGTPPIVALGNASTYSSSYENRPVKVFLSDRPIS